VGVANIEYPRVEIDPLRLEEEWTNHSQLVLNASDAVARLQFEFDRAEAEFEKKAAEVAQDVRQDPEIHGVVKTTDKAIESAVVLSPLYQAALKKVHEAKWRLGEAKGASTALEHRKRALSLLVELYIRDYYSDVKKRSTEEKEEIRSRGRNRLQELRREEHD
jgi:hypothetical protein